MLFIAEETYRLVGVLPDGGRVPLLCRLALDKAREHRRTIVATSRLAAVEIELERPGDYPVSSSA